MAYDSISSNCQNYSCQQGFGNINDDNVASGSEPEANTASGLTNNGNEHRFEMELANEHSENISEYSDNNQPPLSRAGEKRPSDILPETLISETPKRQKTGPEEGLQSQDREYTIAFRDSWKETATTTTASLSATNHVDFFQGQPAIYHQHQFYQGI